MYSEKRKCLNCEEEVKPTVNFCHNCGQQVDNNNLKISVLVSEFFENYISFDSRLGRSIVPFLFKPGQLTKAFNNGQRKKYVNPFRLYLIISILFFFLLNEIILRQSDGKGIINVETQTYQVDFKEQPDSINAKLNLQLNNAVLRELSKNENLGFLASFGKLNDFKKKKVIEVLTDEFQAKNGFPKDAEFEGILIGTEASSEKSNIELNLSELDFDLLDRYRYETKISNEALLDSMNLGELSTFQQILFLQVIKVYRADSKTFSKFMIGNGSIAMFFMIPLFALLLKLFFWKRRRFYAEHLIHSLHLHSFAFLLFSLFMILRLSFWQYSVIQVGVILSFIIFEIYTFKSLIINYQGSKISIWFSNAFLSILYLTLAIVIILAEVFISFLLF